MEKTSIYVRMKVGLYCNRYNSETSLELLTVRIYLARAAKFSTAEVLFSTEEKARKHSVALVSTK